MKNRRKVVMSCLVLGLILGNSVMAEDEMKEGGTCTVGAGPFNLKDGETSGTATPPTDATEGDYITESVDMLSGNSSVSGTDEFTVTLGLSTSQNNQQVEATFAYSDPKIPEPKYYAQSGTFTVYHHEIVTFTLSTNNFQVNVTALYDDIGETPGGEITISLKDTTLPLTVSIKHNSLQTATYNSVDIAGVAVNSDFYDNQSDSKTN